MNAMIEQINSAGKAFVEFGAAMLIQSSILIAILLLADLLLRKRVRAVFRYWIWLLVLVKLMLPSSISSPASIGYLVGDKLTSINVNKTATDTTSANISPIIEIESAEVTSTVPMVTLPIEESTPAVTEVVSPPMATAAAAVTWQGVVFVVWLAVVIAMGLLLAQRAMFVCGLVKQAKEANALMKDTLEFCCERMGIKGKIGLKISANATSPAVCGLFQPVILLPQNLGPSLGARDLRAVLMHELAHIKRGDLWVNLAQTILQIVYFYNPLLWLANAMIRRVREQAVDEMVQVAMGEAAQQYPQTLVNVAKLAFKRPALGLRLIGVVESKSALKGRIKRMLDRPIPKSAKLGAIGLLVVIIIGAVLLPMAKAKENQKLLKGIDEKLKVTDKAGELTINSLYMPSPNGKNLVGANKVTMYVDATNNSEKDLYLGLEYYTDSGHIAKVFSPGATSFAQIKKVPATWQGRLEYPIHYNRFVKGGYVKITLAKCAGKQLLKEQNLAFLPPEAEIIYEKKHNITPINDTQPDTGALTDSSFIATLPNGVTVELVGTCQYTEEGVNCYRPDGSPLGRELRIAKWNQRPQAGDTGIMLKVSGPEDISFSYHKIQGTKGWEGSCQVLDENGQELSGWEAALTRFDNEQKTTLMTFGAAAGAWKTVAENDGRKMGINNGISFTQATETEKGVQIYTTDTIGRDVTQRIVAIDNNGKVHPWKGHTGSVSNSQIRQSIGTFPNLKLAQIEKFQFQTRPYEWVTFKNVSLQPGVKTNVEIEGGNVGSDNSSAQTALQGLIDSARAGDTLIIPKGVYTEPILINKSLTLKGESRADCVFEVTANRPAIFIDTKGKGRVKLEDVTIKWQLATSDKNIEYPLAVGVKDSKAEIKNCSFVPLGNPQRSPAAIRAIGFSNLAIDRCRFEGFEYVICYGEGTEGITQDCLIMNCGHQGIINYSGSKLCVERNVITGSKFHAVRCTGGTLNVKDNLIINNDNRGIYLGNRSGSGKITNNLIINNGTGIGGFARSKYEIENNVIADSSYAGIGMDKSCHFIIKDNIFVDNERGWIMFDRGGEGGNTCYRNTFWQNKTDAENFDKTANSINANPNFAAPDNGDFSLKPGPTLQHKQGLTNPQVFKALWKRWENRADKNEPFAKEAGVKTDVEVEGKKDLIGGIVTVKQRSTQVIAGSGGQLAINIGDITAGQVQFSLIEKKEKVQKFLIPTQSVKTGDVLNFEYDNHSYKIKLVKLINYIVGEDEAIFEISAEEPTSEAEG